MSDLGGPFGHFGTTSPGESEPGSLGHEPEAPSPRLTDQIGRHAAKLARRKEHERIENAKKTAQVAVGMVELGRRAPVGILKFYLGLYDSTNDFNLPNTHAEHEQFITEMGKLGYKLRCLQDDETVEFLIDEDGAGFERVLGNIGDLGDYEGTSSTSSPLYEDLLPVEYTVLRQPLAYHLTKPLPQASPADPV